MPNWDQDIRRSLPEYRPREGDVVYNAPYRATQADLNAFALIADTNALQALLDSELNACVERPSLVGSLQGLHFKSTEPFIILIYAAFRSFASTDEADRRLGRAQAFELSIWVPIVKEQVVSGVATSEPAWFLPLVYTAPTASVATGREVYGFPKIPAFLEIPDEGGTPIAVQLREEFEPGTAADAQRRKVERLFSVPKQQIPMRGGWNIDLNGHPHLAAIITRFVANHPVVFRKQVGMLKQGNDSAASSGVVAGYTALIETRIPITRLSSLNLIQQPEASKWSIEGLGPELKTTLGLKELHPVSGIALHDCRLDIQHGREIWVSRDRGEFIKPLAAPGNDLIWDLHPFSTMSSGLSKSSQQADDGGDHVQGVAEVYFGETRPFAIQALLDRHFPDHLQGRPTADTEEEGRDFVMFVFVRANDNQKVKLYELSVWVPVRHEGKSAWYSPYMFRSPGSAVIQARQRFGHPCQEGFIEFVDAESHPRTVSVRLPTSVGNRGVEWIRQPGIRFERSVGEQSKFSLEAAERALDSDQQNVVGLMQFRHAADTTRACLQEVVRSQRVIKVGKNRRALGDWKVTLPGQLRFGRLLNLSGDSQVVRGYRFDDITIETSGWAPHGKKEN